MELVCQKIGVFVEYTSSVIMKILYLVCVIFGLRLFAQNTELLTLPCCFLCLSVKVLVCYFCYKTMLYFI